ncbi:MAG: DUF2127 domain-containing protein [Thermoanaerobaculia bacterium]
MRDSGRGRKLLILIGAFRLTKAVLLILAGVGTLRLERPGTLYALARWAHDLPIAPGRGVLIRSIQRFAHLSPDRKDLIAAGLFAYATLFLFEGVGLILERVWAEYLTIIATTSFIPFEIYEVIKRVTPIRIALLAVNIAIVSYLIWRRRTRRHE